MIKSRTAHHSRRTVTPLLKCCYTLAAATMSLMLTSQDWAAAEDMPAPDDTRPMTGVELYMLYRDKSWQWPNGAGRMQDEGRVFTAWSGSGSDATWAMGRWIVTDSGRLCLKADWHSAQSIHKARTCFRHRTDGRTIYQKAEGGTGDWYVFRHAEPKKSDEASKLVREDLVSDVLNDLRNPLRQPGQEQGAQVKQSFKTEEAGG